MKIYLIGMPGVGKSTIGKILASKLRYDFIDLDLLIEEKYHSTIPEIFEKGEAFFRDCETKTLASIKRNNVVVSTGGGIVKNKNNLGLMNGIRIYLYADINRLSERCKDSNRPLLKTNSLEKLWNERKNKYEKFSSFKVINHNIDDTIKIIMRRISNENINY